MARRVASFLLLGALYLSGLGTVGLIDYDEAVYAEVARSMYEDGNWLEPHLAGEPFFEKPPLLYWSEIIGYHAFSVSALGARVPNALAALLTVLALYGFGRRPLGERRAFLAALVLGLALQWTVQARVAITDVWLTLFFVLTLGCMHRAFESDRETSGRGLAWFLLAALCSALAMLTKGAIGGMLPAGAAFFHLWTEGRRRRLFDPRWLLPALLILVGVGFSWYLALGFTHPQGFQFMQELFVEHHWGRFSDPMQGHSGSPLYYLPVILGGLLPFSPFLIPAFARHRYRARATEGDRFVSLFLWFGGLTFLLFTVAATKLPNYITPAYPALALLIGGVFHARQEECESPLPRSWRVAYAVWFLVILIATVFFLALPLVVERLPEWLAKSTDKEPGLLVPFDVGFGPWLAGATLLATMVFVGVALRRGAQALHVFAGIAVGAFLLAACLTQLVFPRYDEHFQAPLREMARVAHRNVRSDEPLVLVGLRNRPSITFYGDVSMVRVGKRAQDALATLFAPGSTRIGLTSRPIYDGLIESHALQIIEERQGWIVFRAVRRST